MANVKGIEKIYLLVFVSKGKLLTPIPSISACGEKDLNFRKQKDC